MCFGPCDVSGIVNRTSDVNFAVGFSRKYHRSIGKLASGGKKQENLKLCYKSNMFETMLERIAMKFGANWW